MENLTAKKLEKLAKDLDYYMSWAETWHRQAGGYMASDTALGVMAMERWAEKLKMMTGKPEESLRRSIREQNAKARQPDTE